MGTVNTIAHSIPLSLRLSGWEEFILRFCVFFDTNFVNIQKIVRNKTDLSKCAEKMLATTADRCKKKDVFFYPRNALSVTKGINYCPITIQECMRSLGSITLKAEEKRPKDLCKLFFYSWISKQHRL